MSLSDDAKSQVAMLLACCIGSQSIEDVHLKELMHGFARFMVIDRVYACKLLRLVMVARANLGHNIDFSEYELNLPGIVGDDIRLTKALWELCAGLIREIIKTNRVAEAEILIDQAYLCELSSAFEEKIRNATFISKIVDSQFKAQFVVPNDNNTILSLSALEKRLVTLSELSTFSGASLGAAKAAVSVFKKYYK
jgi:hypothetical protein